MNSNRNCINSCLALKEGGTDFVHESKVYIQTKCLSPLKLVLGRVTHNPENNRVISEVFKSRRKFFCKRIFGKKGFLFQEIFLSPL